MRRLWANAFVLEIEEAIKKRRKKDSAFLCVGLTMVLCIPQAILASEMVELASRVILYFNVNLVCCIPT